MAYRMARGGLQRAASHMKKIAKSRAYRMVKLMERMTAASIQFLFTGYSLTGQVIERGGKPSVSILG